MSASKNLEYKKTSFLNKSNNAFIEQMYVKFINKDPSLPEGWKEYFLDISEDLDSVVREIKGPSWSPKKVKIKEIEGNKGQGKQREKGGRGGRAKKRKRQRKEASPSSAR